MNKRMGAGLAALGILAVLGGGLPAHASEGKAQKGKEVRLTDVASGGCVRAAQWGANGALASILIEDRVIWRSKTAVEVGRSWATGENVGCLNGYRYSGGTKSMSVSWTFTGRAITSCTIGVGQGNCTISDTKANDSYSTGTLANKDGVVAVNAGGGSIYATGTAAGAIDNYSHNASARFSINGQTTMASSTNYVSRNF